MTPTRITKVLRNLEAWIINYVPDDLVGREVELADLQKLLRKMESNDGPVRGVRVP